MLAGWRIKARVGERIRIRIRRLEEDKKKNRREDSRRKKKGVGGGIEQIFFKFLLEPWY